MEIHELILAVVSAYAMYQLITTKREVLDLHKKLDKMIKKEYTNIQEER